MTESKSRNNMLLFFSGVLFLVIVGIVFKNRFILIQVVLGVDKFWLVSGLICYLLNYYSRAYRIRSYLHNSLPLFPDVLHLTCFHGFASYLFPVRTGDLALPVLLKFYHKIPVIEGGRILLRARILDVFSLGPLLLAATFFCTVDLSVSIQIVFYLVGFCFVGLPYALILLARFNEQWLMQYLPFFKGKDVFIFPSIKEVFQSLLIWLWTGSTLFCVIRSLDIPLSFLDVWFFTTIQLPLQLLPFQGFANSGNHEVGWIVTLSLLGLDRVDGVALSLASHIILLSYVLCMGFVALVLSVKTKKIEIAEP